MTTIRVGGINPIKRVKTLTNALAIAKDDDVIEIHKTLNESVVIDKNVIIHGNRNKFIVPLGKTGIHATTHVELFDLNIKAGPRSNALVCETSARLEHIDFELTGKIREFYPLVFFKTGTVHCYDCQLQGVRASQDATVVLERTALNSYYPGDVVLASFADASIFEGNVTATDSFLASCVFNGDLTATSCDFVRFVNIHHTATISDSDIRNVTLSAKKNWRKKEPDNGPLSDELVDLRYTIMFKGATAKIKHYAVTNALPEFTGIVAIDSTLAIENTRCSEKLTTHKVVDSIISFKDTIDQNLWFLSNSSMAQIRSTVASNQAYETALNELTKLTGLQAVRDAVNTIVNTIQARSTTTNKNAAFSYHMVFSGNPGSGKTTVARLVTRALFEIGAIREDKLIEASNETLIGKHVGETAIKTKAVIDSAKGGVLFVDEAYELAFSKDETSFNSEALSVLISQIESSRDDLIVIMAGYPNEMRDLLASNVGLTRRMQWVNFEDYSVKEMTTIFNQMLDSYGEVYDSEFKPDAENVLNSCFKELTQFYLKTPDANGHITNGGNGGLVRNAVQAVITCKNNRMADDNVNVITHSDVVNGFRAEAIKAVNILKPTP